MTREDMIEYIIELEGNCRSVLMLTKPMNDFQLKMMYEEMLKQQNNFLLEAAFE